MHDYSLAHLTDAVLVRELAALVARDRITTAELLAHIAEVDARKLYVPAGYPSMFEYCVEELRLSEDAAYRRIRAARAARQFPVLFAEVAEGGLHLAAICLLAPHLSRENAGDLIAGAKHRKKSEIESWLAGRFPAPEGRAVVRAIAISSRASFPMDSKGDSLLLGPVGNSPSQGEAQLVPGRVGWESGNDQLVPGRVGGTSAGPSLERYLIQVTVGKSTHDKLRHAQALLSHVVSHGDVAQVIDRALQALIDQLEKRKVGAPAAAPRRQSSSARPRHIPTQVKRAVWERDQGRCTYVSANGRRCGSRQFLEFDHVEPVARGGRASVEGIRLRCRAHNQFEAERAFGNDFMRRKRHEARVTAAKKREARLAAARARAKAEAQEQSRDVLAGLRSLGCRADEARRAAEFSEAAQAGTLEERMRVALQFLNRRSGRPALHSPTPST
jgi:5-methylcytosine-specific restriction endonuclease McrA